MFKFTFRNYKRAGERVLSGIKILHTSNLCLDHVLTDYHKGVRKVKRSELLESFDFIIDKSIELSVNALVIAGGIISAASGLSYHFGQGERRFRQAFTKGETRGLQSLGTRTKRPT